MGYTESGLSHRETSTMRALERAGLLKSLLEIRRRLVTFFSARDVWEILSPAQRKCVGGELDTAWTTHGTLGLWMIATDQANRFEALIALARQLGILTPGQVSRMTSVVGESPMHIPSWDKQNLELRFQGQLIRTVEKPNKAFRILPLLDAFEIGGWPWRISSPFDPGPAGQTLHRAIRSLNEGLKMIRFHSDRRGGGVRWSHL